MYAELMETKEFKVIKKIMGEKNAKEFIRRESDDLKNLIALNKMHIQEATAKTKSNDAYLKACETKKDFEGALRETVKPLEAASTMAARVLRERKVDK